MYDYVCYNVVFVGGYCCHSLRGLCGLKSGYQKGLTVQHMSQPARAVWIEIDAIPRFPQLADVTACEGCVDWNLPFFERLVGVIVTACEGCVDWNPQAWGRRFWRLGHSLRGLCGLKYTIKRFRICFPGSQPARAVWIEICMVLITPSTAPSQPARAVWIEIDKASACPNCGCVTACEGCVDWNMNASGVLYIALSVTACEGCVDWNSNAVLSRAFISVTACEGCVDWNRNPYTAGRTSQPSQPARAVWIEISTLRFSNTTGYGHSLRGLCGLKSAPPSLNFGIQSHSLRGLCGLKYFSAHHMYRGRSSQPARAVWIEISYWPISHFQTSRHSLRGLCGLKCCRWSSAAGYSRHSLRGLCGLKYSWYSQHLCLHQSQPARIVWIEICP